MVLAQNFIVSSGSFLCLIQLVELPCVPTTGTPLPAWTCTPRSSLLYLEICSLALRDSLGANSGAVHQQVVILLLPDAMGVESSVIGQSKTENEDKRA